MCGIVGIAGSALQAIGQLNLKKAVARLQHRGPDAEGLFWEPPVAMGHRRLSILDLSQAANQPMMSHNGRYVCVFNGEIYNFRQLCVRFALQPRTQSDTEVILLLFEKLGEAFIHELNGMFAIAIYDRWEQKLWLWRDRIGVKPLYYYYDGDTLAFASELKALEQLGLSLSIDSQSLLMFLHVGYIPAPKTVYKRVYKLMPGYTLVWQPGGYMRLDCYWHAADFAQVNNKISWQQAIEHLHSLLRSSVRYRLISDVPVGVLLSGGVDSSLVAALAAAESQQPIKTFSVGFDQAAFDEAPYAERVAKHLGTLHTTIHASVEDMQALLMHLHELYDEPFADESALPTLAVSRLAKQQVSVALGGDGGDELFWGYGVYQWASRTQASLFRMLRPLWYLMGVLPDRRLRKIAAMSRKVPQEQMMWHIFSQEQGFFSIDEICRLGVVQQSTSKYMPLVPTLPACSPAYRQAFFDLLYYLPDDLLTKIDRASMHVALEVRVPLLDYRVVEFALSLPDAYKYYRGVRKRILREVLATYLPPAYFDRPKQGFSIPLAKWMAGPLKEFFLDELSADIVKHVALVDYKQVEQLKKSFIKGEHTLYRRLWVLWVLHSFMKHLGRSS